MSRMKNTLGELDELKNKFDEPDKLHNNKYNELKHKFDELGELNNKLFEFEEFKHKCSMRMS